MDSIHVSGKSFLVLNDSTIYIQNDTVLFLPDSVILKLRKDRETRSEQFYIKLKEKLSKRRATKELYDLLFKDPVKKAKPVINKAPPSDEFKKYNGRVIGQIYLKKLEPFGTRITDTARHTDNWYMKTANNLHIKTQSRVIRNNLFFKSGDEVEDILLKDSERILRTLPFIRDARIYIIPKEGTFEVDVLVVTQEVWSLTPGFSYSGFDDFSVELTDKNILGTGHELKNEFPYNANEDPTLGYLGTYTINNIRRSFATGELTYANSQNFDRQGVRVFRNFITPYIKYGGGFEIAKENRLQSKIFTDTTLFFYAQYNFQDFWFGRSFLINEDKTGHTNFQIAGRYYRIRHFERPVVNRDTNQLYYDTNLKLMSIGLTKRRFERSSLIIGYGRTEDIPIGYLFEVTFGRDLNEFTNRTYVGSQVSYGDYIGKLGYLRPTFSLGGFVENKQFEQAVFSPELDFFSYLYRVRRTSFRQFFTLRYVWGFKRFTDEYVNINDRNGIRGFEDVLVRGTKKITFRSETVAFTPMYFAGFRLAIFGFVDLAIINDRNAKLLKNSLYQGYGIGFRFRNENLAFNTLQIRLAYYPNNTPVVPNYDINFAGQNRLNVPDFRVNEPQILGFN